MRATLAGTCLWFGVICTPVPAWADSIAWPQPDGKGTQVVLTYSFSNLFDGQFNSELSEEAMREAIAAAFAIWARHAPLHFRETVDLGPPPGEDEYHVGPGTPDIRIGYMETLPGGAAAHAHLPTGYAQPKQSGLAGDVHFSNDVSAFGTRTWGAAIDGEFALDFFSAMLHEVGHAIGLHHLFDTQAVMGNVFLVFEDWAAADLLPGDIDALRALYGAGNGSVQTLGSPGPPIPEPGTIAMIATGLGWIGSRRFRRLHA
jgi:hypothetical protein